VLLLDLIVDEVGPVALDAVDGAADHNEVGALPPQETPFFPFLH
jgi:hypothetical protein